MKNKNIIVVYTIGSFLVFMLFLIIILSILKLFVPKEEKIIEKSIISQDYSLVDIEKISFDFKKSNSTFLIGDGDDLVIVQNTMEEKFYLNFKQKGNTLCFDEDSYIINPQKKKYIIYIPKSYLNKITITNGFGEVDVSNIKNDIDINNNSGKITFNNIGNINIKDVSGDISLKNIEGLINVSTSTGDIAVENIAGMISAETITGDILITGFNILGESYFENVSGDIEIQMAPESLCKINYSNDTGKTIIAEEVCKSDYNIMTVKNITGTIKIN